MNCPHCPNTVLAMIDRQGVEIDYCPACRGVWLDRGELDKLLEWLVVIAKCALPWAPALPFSLADLFALADDRYAVMVCQHDYTPRGTVILFEGYTEFLEKYFETIRDLQTRGFTTIMAALFLPASPCPSDGAWPSEPRRPPDHPMRPPDSPGPAVG